MERGEWVQCNTCGGQFMPVQPDGTEYHHACPDRRMVRAAETDPTTGKVISDAVFEKIANRRDERVVSDELLPDGVTHKVTIVSEGLGVTPIAAPAAAA